jgi:hypothetical protein
MPSVRENKGVREFNVPTTPEAARLTATAKR